MALLQSTAIALLHELKQKYHVFISCNVPYGKKGNDRNKQKDFQDSK